jgi:hypothetical protein
VLRRAQSVIVERFLTLAVLDGFDELDIGIGQVGEHALDCVRIRNRGSEFVRDGGRKRLRGDCGQCCNAAMISPGGRWQFDLV